MDVLDLSLRCGHSQPLSTIDHVDWTKSSPTTSSSHVTQVNTLPPWSSCYAAPARYDLEPVSPSSSPGGDGSSSVVVRRELDAAFYPRRSPEHRSPSPQGRWSCSDGAVVVTTSTVALQPASGAAGRRWNGDAGVPYSPLKRVLHQYRSSVATEQSVQATAQQTSTINGCTRYSVYSRPNE